MKKLILMFPLVVSISFAALDVYEPFDCTESGSSAKGLLGNWTEYKNINAVNAVDGLTYKNLETYGGAMLVDAGDSGVIFVEHEADIKKTKWFSFLISQDSREGHAFINMRNMENGAGHSDGAVGHPWADKWSIHNEASEKDFKYGETQFAVVRYEPDYEPNITLWVNPPLGQEPSEDDATLIADQRLAPNAAICLNLYKSKAIVDEFRIGDTYADVTPITATPQKIEQADSQDVYEPFDYEQGENIIGQTGAKGARGCWTANKNIKSVVVTKGLTYENLATDGGAMVIDSGKDGFVFIEHGANIKQTKWFSFLVYQDTRVGHAFINIGKDNNGAAGHPWEDKWSIHNEESNLDFKYGETQFAVVRYEPDSEPNITLWVNPSLDQEPSEEDATLITNQRLSKDSVLCINVYESKIILDEFRIGDTYADVAPKKSNKYMFIIIGGIVLVVGGIFLVRRRG